MLPGGGARQGKRIGLSGRLSGGHTFAQTIQTSPAYCPYKIQPGLTVISRGKIIYRSKYRRKWRNSESKHSNLERPSSARVKQKIRSTMYRTKAKELTSEQKI